MKCRDIVQNKWLVDRVVSRNSGCQCSRKDTWRISVSHHFHKSFHRSIMVINYPVSFVLNRQSFYQLRILCRYAGGACIFVALQRLVCIRAPASYHGHCYTRRHPTQKPGTYENQKLSSRKQSLLSLSSGRNLLKHLLRKPDCVTMSLQGFSRRTWFYKLL